MTKFLLLKIGLLMSALAIFTLLVLPPKPGLAAALPQTPPGHLIYEPAVIYHHEKEAPKNLATLDPSFMVNYTTTCTTTGLPNFLPVSASNTLSWTVEAKAALEYAVNIWAMLVKPTQKIVINACWVDMGPPSGFISMSQPVSAHADFTGAPVTHTLYAAALANELAGTDLNDHDGPDHDGDGVDADAEMVMVFNSNPSVNWYYGLDAQPPSNQYDFVTTVLHEMAHGLGFISTFYVGEEMCGALGVGCWGTDPGDLLHGMPAIFDKFVVNQSNQLLVDTGVFSNPSAELANALVQTLIFSGANAKLTTITPTLYTPNPFEPSSSILHLDEDTYDGTPDQLLTPIIDIGTAQHHPGPIMLGMLKDIGWPTVELRPVVFTQSASAGTVTSGQVFTYTLTVTNTGYMIMTNVVLTDTVPPYTTLNAASLGGSSVTTSGTTAGSVITWTTGVSLTTGQVLSRPFAVTVDTHVTGVSQITNTAFVTSATGIGARSDLGVAVISDPPIADLQLVKTVIPTGPVNPGQIVTYTLTFTNNGPDEASGVVITDKVPVTVTNVTTASAGAVITPINGSTYSWVVADLANGTGGVITIAGRISSALTVGGWFTNTATITSLDQIDPNLNNNTYSTTVTIPANNSGQQLVYLPIILREVN